MLFSERDIDVLRLLNWCQFAPKEAVLSIMPQSEIDALISVGFIKLNEPKGAFVITAKGTRALAIVLEGKLPT
ncbi:MAG: hypothetical protein IJV64_02010, partial [Oscillospiraceae bacterium]|nr:hypothetical protein [Oscillospiraceae bacterium]